MQSGEVDVGGLLRHQYPALMRAALLLTGNQADAHDLVQDACVAALARSRAVAKADQPAAYLRKILLNEFLRRRRRKASRELPLAEVPEWSIEEGTAPLDRVVLRKALVALPPRQRAAVVLRHYEDFSEQDTARLLGCSVGNVKSLSSRGLAALREAMPKLEEVDG